MGIFLKHHLHFEIDLTLEKGQSKHKKLKNLTVDCLGLS